jgi:hypothetical protein
MRREEQESKETHETGADPEGTVDKGAEPEPTASPAVHVVNLGIVDARTE